MRLATSFQYDTTLGELDVTRTTRSLSSSLPPQAARPPASISVTANADWANALPLGGWEKSFIACSESTRGDRPEPSLSSAPRDAEGARLQNGAAMAHSFQPFDWDDLKHLLAVARHGSTLAAGRALGVDQSTVQRRLSELERRLGRPLVQRQPTGYRLTEFGAQMVPYAERVEEAVRAFERRLDGAELEADGVIRMTCPEPIVHRSAGVGAARSLSCGVSAIPPADSSPAIAILDLHKGEADVALRSGDTDDDELVGRKIADSIWAVYASTAYIERHGKPAIGRGPRSACARRLRRDHDASIASPRGCSASRPTTPPVARNNSVLGLLYSVKAGIGVGPLPTPLGDARARPRAGARSRCRSCAAPGAC